MEKSKACPGEPAICSASNEQWRPIPRYNGYEASSLGRIRSVDRTSDRGYKLKGRVLRSTPIKSGYLMVKPNSVAEYVHVLVLEAFAGDRPPGMEVCHYNGNKQDNRPANLRWGTRIENMADRDRHGVIRRGERSGTAKLTPQDIRQIVSLSAEGKRQRAIAEVFGVSRQHISAVLLRKVWFHLDAA